MGRVEPIGELDVAGAADDLRLVVLGMRIGLHGEFLPQAVATASAASTRMRFLVRVACSNLTRPVTVANTV